jgi:formylglycine-generating enzyme required for sulfatase activity
MTACLSLALDGFTSGNPVGGDAGGETVAVDRGGSDANGDGDADRCAVGLGPPMVHVLGFCIDSTLVSQADYAPFLHAETLGKIPLPGICAAKTGYGPPLSCATPFDEKSPLPVVCVDWCDAYAYCAWAGKRLCGHIGGGSNPYDSFADAAASQWYAACSQNGRFTYPYGSNYDPRACNGADLGLGKTTVPGLLSTCASYPGLFDMSGNVFEHEDSWENDGGTVFVRARGGGYRSNKVDLACNGGNWNSPLGENEFTGLRCCKD